jgi:YgiT-type zinc finger domain-containing protein
MSGDILLRIQRIVRDKHYLIADYVLDEADNNGLSESEILDILLRPRLVSFYGRNSIRFVASGYVGKTEVDVACRFRGKGTLLIIIYGICSVVEVNDMTKREYPCEFCDTDKPQEKKLVTVTRNRLGKWFIFEDVPAWVCPNCGHRYFDAATVTEMENRMKARPSDARPVEAWAMSLTKTE